jgi:SPX domain protein involved in polyphosphate accumulation
MKNRLEYKYLVSMNDIDKLRNGLLKYLDYDAYASLRPNKEYTVRSIYFDSYDYKGYYEKLDGIHTRKKFRVRGYNQPEDNSRIFYEIKRKYDNFISKDRAGTYFKDIQTTLKKSSAEMHFIGEDRNYFNNFYYYYSLVRLEPKVLVVYEREAFECKFGSQLRITFDKFLRNKEVDDYDRLFDEDGLRESYRNKFILEVKFFQVLPQWIDRVLEKFNLTRIAVSKYTSSIDTQSRSSVTLNKLNRIDSYN